MPRDYRRPAAKKKGGAAGKRSPQPRWVWLTGGLLLGAVLGYGGYLLQHQWSSATTRDTPPVEAKAKPKSAPAPAHKEAAKGNETPRFEFYTLLPEMEVQISDEKLKEALRAPPKNVESGAYILQVGSFRRLEEADNLKARLALLGIEAKIQTVIIRDDDIWYRVRVGPYSSLRDLSQASSRLRNNDIDFMLLRIGA